MKKKILLFFLLVLTVSVLFTSCNSMEYSSDGANTGGASGDYGSSDSNTVGGGASDVISADQKIIKTVYEEIETEKYDETIEKLKAAVAEAGGYFASSRYMGAGVETENRREAVFEIRIPAEKLDDFTGKVGTIATVVNYNETTSDVTLSYVDIESRIAVLEAEEQALLSLLSKATNTSSILEIRKSLSDTQSSLASLRAQKQRYDSLISYSTVHLQIDEVVQERTRDASFFTDVGDMFEKSLSAIGSFFRAIGVFLLGASPILLLLAVIGVGTFFIVKLCIRRDKKKKSGQKKDEKNNV